VGALVEHPRRDLEGSLPCAQVVFQHAEGAHGQGPEPERHAKVIRVAPAARMPMGPITGGVPSRERSWDEFAIRGHAPESNEHSHEDTHWQGEAEDSGECAKEQDAQG